MPPTPLPPKKLKQKNEKMWKKCEIAKVLLWKTAFEGAFCNCLSHVIIRI